MEFEFTIGDNSVGKNLELLKVNFLVYENTIQDTVQ
jgi:hypothetical protein